MLFDEKFKVAIHLQIFHRILCLRALIPIELTPPIGQSCHHSNDSIHRPRKLFSCDGHPKTVTRTSIALTVSTVTMIVVLTFARVAFPFSFHAFSFDLTADLRCPSDPLNTNNDRDPDEIATCHAPDNLCLCFCRRRAAAVVAAFGASYFYPVKIEKSDGF
jgi:hypothetical protein